MGVIPLLGGGPAMVKSGPISGWAGVCLSGTSHCKALCWCLIPGPEPGLPILPQHLTEDSALSSAEAGVEDSGEAFNWTRAESASGLRWFRSHK